MTSDGRLPRWRVAGWGFADTGINVFFIAKQLLVFAFMVQYLGVPVALAGAVTTGILVFDIFTDPIIGFLSDKTRTRFGRRIPYLLVGAPVMAAGLVLLFSAPGVLSGGSAALWVAGFFALATIGFTLVAIPYSAMPAEMTKDPRERSRLTAWRMGFSSLGILLAGAAFPAMVGMFAAGGDPRAAHMTAALVLSPLIILPVWIAAFAGLGAPRAEHPATAPMRDQLAAIGRNRPFLLLVMIYGFLTLGIAILTAGIPFAAVYLLTDAGASPLSGAAAALGNQALLFLFFVLGSILSQPLWLWASARLGKPRALVVGSLGYALVLLLLFAILPGTDVTIIAIVILVAGLFNGAYQQIPWALMPDLIDLTTNKDGINQEGVFSAAFLFGQKAAGALGPGLMGLLLASAGWRETTSGFVDQSEAAIATLQWVVTLLPAILLAITAIAYRLLLRRTAMTN